MLRIAIIVGSMRPGRKGETVARWVYEIADWRGDAEFELVDIKDYDLPLLDEPSLGDLRPILERSHEGMVGQDRILRRVRLRDARVQPCHVGSAEECDRLPLQRVEQQGDGFRRLRRRGRHPSSRAAAGLSCVAQPGLQGDLQGTKPVSHE